MLGEGWMVSAGDDR